MASWEESTDQPEARVMRKCHHPMTSLSSSASRFRRLCLYHPSPWEAAADVSGSSTTRPTKGGLMMMMMELERSNARKIPASAPSTATGTQSWQALDAWMQSHIRRPVPTANADVDAKPGHHFSHHHHHHQEKDVEDESDFDADRVAGLAPLSTRSWAEVVSFPRRPDETWLGCSLSLLLSPTTQAPPAATSLDDHDLDDHVHDHHPDATSITIRISQDEDDHQGRGEDDPRSLLSLLGPCPWGDPRTAPTTPRTHAEEDPESSSLVQLWTWCHTNSRNSDIGDDEPDQEREHHEEQNIQERSMYQYEQPNHHRPQGKASTCCACSCPPPHFDWTLRPIHYLPPPSHPSSCISASPSSSSSPALGAPQEEDSTPLGSSSSPFMNWGTVTWVDLRAPSPLSSSPRGSAEPEPLAQALLEAADLTTGSSSPGGSPQPSTAMLLHFLRSLLGTASRSPWLSSSTTSSSNENRVQDGPEIPVPISNTHTPLPPREEADHHGVAGPNCECLVLILPLMLPSSESAPDNRAAFVSHFVQRLESFRVSDACADWSLYSAVNLDLPPILFNSRGECWPAPYSSLVNSDLLMNSVRKQAVRALIYRRLPPRVRLHSVHPITGQEAPCGCLWERYQAQQVPAGEAAPSLLTMSSYPRDSPGRSTVLDLPPPAWVEQIRAVGPPYIHLDHILGQRPLLDHLLATHLAELQSEARSIANWTAWPEATHYRNHHRQPPDENPFSTQSLAPWHVFPLCYCFPATSPENLTWIPQTCRQVPRTVQLLKEAFGNVLRTALFSRLDPESVLEAHTGWEDLANHVFRIHIPLIVPGDDEDVNAGLCGTWVDGCVETLQTGRCLVFDDSKVHRAFNYSTLERIVLIVDIARPSWLPTGTATGGHSAELDEFIARMSGPVEADHLLINNA